MGTQHLLKSVACQWRQLSYELKSTSVPRNEDPPVPPPPRPHSLRGGGPQRSKLLKWGLPARGSHLLKSDRPLTPR